MIWLYFPSYDLQSTTELILLSTIYTPSPIVPQVFRSYTLRHATFVYYCIIPILLYVCSIPGTVFLPVYCLLSVLLPLLPGWKNASASSYMFSIFYLKLLHVKESLARCIFLGSHFLSWVPSSTIFSQHWIYIEYCYWKLWYNLIWLGLFV